jgi:hypothetical protein
MLDKLKDKFVKIDKKALGASIGLMLISWAALPIIYWLIVRKKPPMEEVKVEEKENGME